MSHLVEVSSVVLLLDSLMLSCGAIFSFAEVRHHVVSLGEISSCLIKKITMVVCWVLVR